MQWGNNDKWEVLSSVNHHRGTMNGSTFQVIAPLACTIEADERMGADGKIVRPLKKGDLTKQLKKLLGTLTLFFEHILK